jgi:hypothetical protein
MPESMPKFMTMRRRRTRGARTGAACAVALRVIAVSLPLPLPLTGCGSGDDISRTFGLTRDAPDEFEVTTRAPLSMPPDDTLRPPQPGATRPQEQSQRRQAEAALAPDIELDTTPAASSPGQRALLQAAGPAAPADIRRKLGAEADLDAQSRSWTDRLLFWKKPPPPGVVVDPAKEAQRLRENAALGRSVEAGDTPIIQRKKDGLFNSLF